MKHDPLILYVRRWFFYTYTNVFRNRIVRKVFGPEEVHKVVTDGRMDKVT